MDDDCRKKFTALPLPKITVTDGFWGMRQEVNRQATLPTEHRLCHETGRIDAFKLDWRPGMEPVPHIFWDSDVAKWIEAAGYSLGTHPDTELAELADSVIDLIVAAQQPDGYLNAHFTAVEPEKRWSNLRDCHELYCAGHLMEAAVAYYEGTGKRKLLDTMCRYADCIAREFGTGPDQKRGYPGHEEIELALVKLANASGRRNYLDLAKYFIDERGREPKYFSEEAVKRGEKPGEKHGDGTYSYNQAHRPVREQSEAVGHAVRAVYLYTGMAEVAAATNDAELFATCRRLWENIVTRRMYVTGGIGSRHQGETFTVDYHLPNYSGYAETCAAIGLVFFARRMLESTANAEYADVLERALYNGVASGVSLDGKSFFYANPLAVEPALSAFNGGRWNTRRQEWFGCSCCPPNIARIFAELGHYIYGQKERTAFVHLYVAGLAEFSLEGNPVVIHQETTYPWEEKTLLLVSPDRPEKFTLALRLPGWCAAPVVKINGQAVDLEGLGRQGYVYLEREWHSGDQVELTMPMPVERIRANPRVAAAAGRIALQRGPLVYCLEQTDNGENLEALSLPKDAELSANCEAGLLGGIVTVEAEGRRDATEGWEGTLYRPSTAMTAAVPAKLRAVPYAYWANREPGEMLVWLRES